METSLRQIAVGLSGSDYDNVTSVVVMELAQRTLAKVDMYLIRPMSDDPQLLMSSGFSGNAFRGFIEHSEKIIVEFDKTAHQAFEAAKADFPEVEARYHDPFSNRSRLFSTVVWAADLAVMTHPALVNVHYYKAAVLDAIADSGRPILLLPEGKNLGNFKHMLIVWRSDTRHAQALATSLPILRLADEVTVMSHDDGDFTLPGGDVAGQYLTAHGIKVRNVVIKANERFTRASIDAYCDKNDISMIIMGGGLQSDLVDQYVTDSRHSATQKPLRAILALG